MFTVKKDEYINKTFRMPVELVHKMEIIAQKEKVSLNNLLVQCCNYALDKRLCCNIIGAEERGGRV